MVVSIIDNESLKCSKGEARQERSTAPISRVQPICGFGGCPQISLGGYSVDSRVSQG